MMLFWTLILSAFADPAVLDRYAAPVLPGLAPAPQADATPFVWVVQPLELAPGSSGKLVLKLIVPNGTHVYRDQVEVLVAEAGTCKVGAASLPPGMKKADPADPTAVRELYDLDVIVEVPITAPRTAAGVLPVRLDVRVQGCREGLCYPPTAEVLEGFVHIRAEPPKPR